MKFDVYGRFRLEVRREGDTWAVFRLDGGRRARDGDIVVPPELEAGEIAGYLDDLFHELSRPGERVALIQ